MDTARSLICFLVTSFNYLLLNIHSLTLFNILGGSIIPWLSACFDGSLPMPSLDAVVSSLFNAILFALRPHLTHSLYSPSLPVSGQALKNWREED